MRYRFLLLLPALAVASGTGRAQTDSDPEQAAVDACVAELSRRDGSGDGRVVDRMFSEAGTMVFLEGGDGRMWQCLGYGDGSVASLDLADPAEAEAAVARGAEAAGWTPERIRFAPGSSSATLARTIEAGGASDFAFDAQAGQTLDLRLVPQDGEMYYFIKAPDGSFLIQGTDASETFEGPLPLTGDYLVEVVNRESAPVTFKLTVAIR